MTFDFIGFSLYSKLADVVFERKKKKNRRLLCAAENSVTVDWWWLETTTGAHVYPSDRVSISPKRQPLNDEINEVIGRRMQNMTQASERASSACMCMARCKKDISRTDDGADFITDDDDERSTAIKRTARNAPLALADAAATQKAAGRAGVHRPLLSFSLFPFSSSTNTRGVRRKKCQRKFQHGHLKQNKRETDDKHCEPSH